MTFRSSPHQIPGLVLIEGGFFPDERGAFMESWREEDFSRMTGARFVQDNVSRSRLGVLRGLHYQKCPAAVGKLVRCVYGRIFDVAADIRRGSPTYGQWASVELAADSNQALWIPEGFAHGFCALTPETVVVYKVDGYYAPEHERGIIWNDPTLAISWPVKSPELSSRDAALPVLDRADNDFDWRKT